MKYDYIIIGAGPFGCTFAYEMHKQNKKVLIIEKRSHIGGNCYTEEKHNIHVHKYGAHIFHTKSKKIWDYINQFATFNNYVHRVMINYGNKIYSFPINLMTLHQLWPEITNPVEAKKKLESVRIKINNPSNFEEWFLSQVGQEIYEKFFLGYTKKQWMRDPKHIPVSIGKRIPIRLTFDNRYFGDDYQGIPIGGYTQIFQKMLDGIEVKTNCDFFKDKKTLIRLSKKLIYTGRIDELFNYKHGYLEYRALKFTQQTVKGDHQGTAVVNYTDSSIAHTRVTEHKHFEFNGQPNSIVTTEYPDIYDPTKTPYYPINNDKNNKLFQKYLAELNSNMQIGGRLGTYKYYNMDQVIAQALQATKNG